MLLTSRGVLRGLFIILFSLFFGLQSLRYPFGTTERIGPGLFPLVISCALCLVGIAILFHAWRAEPVPLKFQVKNISVVILSMSGFALASQYLNMICGIVILVFGVSFAADSTKLRWNIQIATVLIAIALAFQKLLGLDLPLY